MLLVSNLANAYFVKKYSFYRQRDRDMSSTMQSMSRPEGPFLVIMGDSLTNDAHFPSQVCKIPDNQHGTRWRRSLKVHSVCGAITVVQ